MPKIADLGISKVTPSRHESSIIGTPNYMAPEMFEGDYGYGVDIWALGVIYLELLTGKRMAELLEKDEVPGKSPSFPSTAILEQIVDERYRTLVQGMLMEDPKQRINVEEVCSYFEFIKPNDMTKSNYSSRRTTQSHSQGEIKERDIEE